MVSLSNPPSLTTDYAHYPPFATHLHRNGGIMGEPFKTYVAIMSVVNLDVTRALPLDCFNDDFAFDHFDKLTTATIVFPVVTFLLLVRGDGSGVAPHARRTWHLLNSSPLTRRWAFSVRQRGAGA